MTEAALPLRNGLVVRQHLVLTADPLERLIGRTAVMRQVRDHIQRIARSPVPVLIVGETGTGKELCAEAIGILSGRTPLIPVNCAALSESLVESELFGHERGAFTGALRTHLGVIAAADGGTLFLDELAEVSSAVQAKLLRTLESGEYRPLGSTKVMRSQFRILAATNSDLEHIVSTGLLRTDLFHRLGAVRIRLPPLRERLEDIPVLAEDFLRRYLERSDHGPSRISPEACDALTRCYWPGNVRQLRNVVEAAAALAGAEPAVGIDHVVEVLGPATAEPTPADTPPSLSDVRLQAERQAIVDALRRTGGNREQAARLLCISEATLYRKLGGHPDRRSIVRRDTTPGFDRSTDRRSPQS
jgi:two-component system response regulator HydG